MCSRSRENGKKKVGTIIWDTLYIVLALTERGKGEADKGAEGWPHVPAVLEGGHRVHRDPEHGDQQLAADQVHQKQVELCPQLQHSLTVYRI